MSSFIEKIKYLVISSISKKFWKVFENLGFYIIPRHFYFPIPLTIEIKKNNFDEKKFVAGLTFDDNSMLGLLEKFGSFKDEYSQIFENSNFESNGDGAISYGMIRYFKPGKIVEIGSGYSTKVAFEALTKNHNGSLKCVEPYPSKFLNDLSTRFSDIKLIKAKLEDIDIEKEIVKELKPGDFLFIDSSHVFKLTNDVYHELLYILPRLNDDVFIHFHDIRIPQDYPKEWYLTYKHFWTEQYLLYLFLFNNSMFEIIFAGNYMHLKYPQEMKNNLTGYLSTIKGWPGSFWIKKAKV